MAGRREKFIEDKMVPDPSMSDAEYFHQRQKKSGPNIGKVSAKVNMSELIGGFARFDRRTEAQEAAAARYRGLHERAQIGRARAVDYAAVKVDTSGPTENRAGEIGQDARRRYADAVQFLGIVRSSLIERIVVYDVPVSKIAKGSRERERLTREVFAALDDLAVHFGLAKKKAA